MRINRTPRRLLVPALLAIGTLSLGACFGPGDGGGGGDTDDPASVTATPSSIAPTASGQDEVITLTNSGDADAFFATPFATAKFTALNLQFAETTGDGACVAGVDANSSCFLYLDFVTPFDSPAQLQVNFQGSVAPVVITVVGSG